MMSYNQLVVNKQSGALRVRMRENKKNTKYTTALVDFGLFYIFDGDKYIKNSQTLQVIGYYYIE